MEFQYRKMVQEIFNEALEWIDNVNNAYENKNCNLTTCRYNAYGKCTNKEKREECVEVSRKVLCINE